MLQHWGNLNLYIIKAGVLCSCNNLIIFINWQRVEEHLYNLMQIRLIIQVTFYPNSLCGWTRTKVPPSTGIPPHQCLFASTWMRMAQLPCWQPRGQQVSCQRWIWGFHCAHWSKGWCTQVRGSTLALKPRADITRSPKQGNFLSK